MPVTKTAKKALRQNVRRHVRNVAQNTELKKIIKSFKKTAAAKKFEEAGMLLRTVFQKLDKATKTGVIKKNTASRLKSRLSKHISRK